MTTTDEKKVIEFQTAPAFRRSAFVNRDRWVIWELPNKTIGEGTEEQYRDARDSLPEEDRGAVNAVWTPYEMGAHKRAVVSDIMLRVAGQPGENGEITVNLSLHQGAYSMALMRHNIIKWVGPMFHDANGGLTPCNEQSIDQLDSFDPFIQEVARSIGRRNPLGGRRGGVDPKS